MYKWPNASSQDLVKATAAKMRALIFIAAFCFSNCANVRDSHEETPLGWKTQLSGSGIPLEVQMRGDSIIRLQVGHFKCNSDLGLVWYCLIKSHSGFHNNHNHCKYITTFNSSSQDWIQRERRGRAEPPSDQGKISKIWNHREQPECLGCCQEKFQHFCVSNQERYYFYACFINLAFKLILEFIKFQSERHPSGFRKEGSQGFCSFVYQGHLWIWRKYPEDVEEWKNLQVHPEERML